MKKFILLSTLVSALALPLSAQEQSLQVNSDPPGCVVFLDRQIQGATPLTISGLKPGIHLLRVSKSEKFHSYQEEVMVESGLNLRRQIKLTPLSSTYLEDGLKALKLNQPALAKTLLERAAAGPPVQPQAHLGLGKLAREQGRPDEALVHFKNYAQVYPKEPEVHLYLADLHYQAGRLNQAVTSYKIALLNTKELQKSLDQIPPVTWESIKALGEPTNPEEQLKLAYLHELKGQIPEALIWLKRAVAVVFAHQHESLTGMRGPILDR